MCWTAKCKLDGQDLLAWITRGGGGRAGWFVKRCHLLTDHRINCKLKTKIANTILLLRYLDKISNSYWWLLASFGEFIWWREAIKGSRSQWPAVASPQSTTLHSTGNTSVKKEVSHSNTRGTVRLCSIPPEILLHIVYIFNILCWLKVINSRRLQ